jgi:hypothetical protein
MSIVIMISHLCSRWRQRAIFNFELRLEHLMWWRKRSNFHPSLAPSVVRSAQIKLTFPPQTQHPKVVQVLCRENYHCERRGASHLPPTKLLSSPPLHLNHKNTHPLISENVLFFGTHFQHFTVTNCGPLENNHAIFTKMNSTCVWFWKSPRRKAAFDLLCTRHWQLKSPSDNNLRGLLRASCFCFCCPGSRSPAPGWLLCLINQSDRSQKSSVCLLINALADESACSHSNCNWTHTHTWVINFIYKHLMV